MKRSVWVGDAGVSTDKGRRLEKFGGYDGKNGRNKLNQSARACVS